MRMLYDSNVDVWSRETWDEYCKATSVFNGFFGIFAMTAYNAANEACDAYEGTRDWRMGVKKAFKASQRAWERLWGTVKVLFEDRYAVYMDFISTGADDMGGDLQKMFLAVHASLLRGGVADADRKAWVYTADLLAHELKAVYRQFVERIVAETRRELIGRAFAWADPTHIALCANDCVRAVATNDVRMSDDVVLALQIIAQRALNNDYQDEAAIKAVNLRGNERYREEWSDSIAEYEQHKAAKEAAAKEANDAYWRERERQREERRRGRGSGRKLSADEVAATLSEKFNVKRERI